MDSKLSFLLDQSNDFFVVLDRDGNVIHTNKTVREVFGYTEAEINGRNANFFSHPADISRREELLANIAVKREISGYESRIKAKNGRYYNVSWRFTLNEQDNLLYATGINLTDKLNVDGPDSITENIEHIIQSFSEGFFIIDNNWKIKAFNPAFQAITGLTAKQLTNLNFKELNSLGISDKLMAVFENAFNRNNFNEIQYFNEHFNRWLRVNVYPYKNETTIFIRDITNIKRQQLILALEKNVLELNASPDYSLPQKVDVLLKGIEQIFPDMTCSVLELDEALERLYHLSAPSLDPGYIESINGSQIGPGVGSCGTAIYHRTQVIVSDIENDPLWNDYKDIIRPYGLKACWSTPIISSRGSAVLAAFAVYYKTQRKPVNEELRMIERTTNILRVLIENKRNQDFVADQTRRLQEIASISSHELRRPVATILGLVNLFDKNNADNPLNKEIVSHLEITAQELDDVIHTIVEKTIYLKSEQ